MPSQSTPTVLVHTYFTKYLDENFFPNCSKKDPSMIYHFSEDLGFFYSQETVNEKERKI